MGMILGFGIFVGAFIGTVVSALLCMFAIVTIKKASHKRLNVWPLFTAGVVVCLAALLLLIPYYPFDHVTPGTNYDVAMKNFCLKGFFYAASPGVAAVLSLLLTRLCRKTEKEDLP